MNSSQWQFAVSFVLALPFVLYVFRGATRNAHLGLTLFGATILVAVMLLAAMFGTLVRLVTLRESADAVFIAFSAASSAMIVAGLVGMFGRHRSKTRDP